MVGFAQSVALWRYLGDRGFGEYAAAEMLFALAFLLVNAGVQQASVGRLSAAIAAKDRDGVRDAVASFLKAYAVMTLALLLVGSVGMTPLAGLFKDVAAERDRLARLGWLFCWTAPAQAGFNLGVLVLQSHRRMKELAILEATTETAKTILIVVLLVGGFGVEGAILGTVVGLAAGSLGGVVACGRLARESLLPPLGEMLRHVVRAHTIDVFRTGIYLGFGTNVNMLKDQLPMAFLLRVAGEATVGHFRLAVRLTNYPMRVVQAIGRNVLPKLAEDRVRYGTRTLRKTFWKISLYAAAIVAAGTVALLVLLPTVLLQPWPVVFGPTARPVVPLVWILAAGLLVAGGSVAIESWYIVTDRVRRAFVINIVGFALLALPGWWAVSRYGAPGAAAFAVAFQMIALYHLVTIDRRMRAESDAFFGGGGIPIGEEPAEPRPSPPRDSSPELG